MGGVPANPNRGAQVDRVSEIDVVTGQGQLVTCSSTQNRELFEAVLAGVGQFGIIVRARVDLVPLPALVRLHQLVYVDNATAFADLRTLLARGEVDDSFIIWGPNPAGGWIYQLNVTKFYDPSAPPDSDFLMRGLNDITPQRVVLDAPYVPYVLRIDAAIDQLKAAGLWEGVLHPWFDVWLSDAAVESYVGEVLPTLQPDDVGAGGFMLLFPMRRSLLTRPSLRVPGNGEFVWLFDILTAAPAPGPNPAFADRMQTRNRRLFEKARATGGTRYPIGTVRFSRVDWARQYGPRYFTLAQLKRRYDPRGILTPGPGIF
jgi:cytokinin dehydrogenase